eukprot:gb/GEZN01024209.1/.p1 GENE.gb/GEZN01024209.1/~~gb/GEZN01024209.1/.p1  ORF type:complete len:141 (-),score=11.51 gb/GEZN01024209.1/:151-573(-)
MEKFERLSLFQRQVERCRIHVQEEILTLKCPRPTCRKAFLDFVGCFALKCSCGCAFCAWCLLDCGQDAHAHVAVCPKKLDQRVYHSEFRLFEEAQRQSRVRQLRYYLGTLESTALREEVLRALRVDLRDLGLQQLQAHLE